MKPFWRRYIRKIPLLLFLAAGLTGVTDDGSFALKGAMVYPASAPRIANATILVENGNIAAVGQDVKIPPGVQVVDVSGKVIIPGLIDIHSHLGFFDRYR